MGCITSKSGSVSPTITTDDKDADQTVPGYREVTIITETQSNDPEIVNETSSVNPSFENVPPIKENVIDNTNDEYDKSVNIQSKDVEESKDKQSLNLEQNDDDDNATDTGSNSEQDNATNMQHCENWDAVNGGSSEVSEFINKPNIESDINKLNTEHDISEPNSEQEMDISKSNSEQEINIIEANSEHEIDTSEPNREHVIDISTSNGENEIDISEPNMEHGTSIGEENSENGNAISGKKNEHEPVSEHHNVISETISEHGSTCIISGQCNEQEFDISQPVSEHGSSKSKHNIENQSDISNEPHSDRNSEQGSLINDHGYSNNEYCGDAYASSIISGHYGNNNHDGNDTSDNMDSSIVIDGITSEADITSAADEHTDNDIMPDRDTGKSNDNNSTCFNYEVIESGNLVDVQNNESVIAVMEDSQLHGEDTELNTEVNLKGCSRSTEYMSHVSDQNGLLVEHNESGKSYNGRFPTVTSPNKNPDLQNNYTKSVPSLPAIPSLPITNTRLKQAHGSKTPRKHGNNHAIQEEEYRKRMKNEFDQEHSHSIDDKKLMRKAEANKVNTYAKRSPAPATPKIPKHVPPLLEIRKTSPQMKYNSTFPNTPLQKSDPLLSIQSPLPGGNELQQMELKSVSMHTIHDIDRTLTKTPVLPPIGPNTGIETDTSKHMIEKPINIKPDHGLVISISIGNTYTSYTSSFVNNPEKITVNKNWGAEFGTLEMVRNRTVVVVNERNEFVGFGYEGMAKYCDEKEEEIEQGEADSEGEASLNNCDNDNQDVDNQDVDNQDKDNQDKNVARYTLYEDFLSCCAENSQEDSNVSMVTGSTDKLTHADLLSMVLTYMSAHAVKALEKSSGSVIDRDSIKWVIVIRPQLHDETKQAAVKAGLIKTEDSLYLLVLSKTQAALSYYLYNGQQSDLYNGQQSDLNTGQHCDLNNGQQSVLVKEQQSDLNKEQQSDLNKGQQSETDVGSKIMVVHIGGTGMDITIYQTDDTGQHKSITVKTFFDCGGNTINVQFIAKLKTVIGDSFMEDFRCKFPRQSIILELEFEKIKRVFKFNSDSNSKKKLSLTLCSSMAAEYRSINTCEISSLSKSEVAKEMKIQITTKTGKILFPPVIIDDVFTELCSQIVSNIECVLNEFYEQGSIDQMIICGGFVDSGYIQDFIVQRFDSAQLKVIRGDYKNGEYNNGMVTSKGAVLYEHTMGSIIL